MRASAKPFWITLGLAALFGLFQGIGGALVLAGITALCWVIVKAARGKNVLAAAGIPNGVVAAAAVAVIVFGGAVSDAGSGEPAPLGTTSPSPSAGSPSAAPDRTDEDGVKQPSAEPAIEETEPAASDDEEAPQGENSGTPDPQSPDDGTVLAAEGDALAVLATLPTKGRAPKTGYDRDSFAYRSFDADGNGCDVRNDVLRRDLTKVVLQTGTGGCVVLSGMLADPYSGEEIAFTRGQDTSAQVQIDHVVALSDAWQKGAQSWDGDTRKHFGNDPLNLLAVDGPLNNQKGDGDAATWLPPNRGYRCEYVARQIAVKAEYRLWVTKAERSAMEKVLTGCPGQTIPTDVTTPKDRSPKTKSGPKTKSEPSKMTPKADKGSSTVKESFTPPADVYYKNCTAARNAGAAPVYRGDPGYGTHLDRNGDGVGCE
ncbi:hypothetical protein GCM10010401_17070 [Rarobacter faecitabidus]|uniref:Excalibur calcium-binding domain-containing protein n=1 Tax=Rarobacter faecitabidus TaxID=13243 RepID=A0A542ZX26_RARFA|nr:DUF1524 domain-containing protein [Rarobacter faecitabidus]TQL64895.1 excalibur calcium-binding domain-containing protein [Rarobacter faecitabidus]